MRRVRLLTVAILWTMAFSGGSPPVSAAPPCRATVTQVGPLEYGILGKPTAGSQTFDITTNDVTSGTGVYLYGATPVHGSFTISSNGSSNCAATMTLTVTDTGGVTGVTLSNFHLNYNGAAITNGQSGLTWSGTNRTLLLGATATYTSGVTQGTPLHPNFNIRVASP